MTQPAAIADYGSVPTVGPSMLSQRLRQIKLAPTIAMSERAASMRREGRDVIPMALGELDFDTPGHVIERAHAAACEGLTRYTAPDGAPFVKDAVIAKLARDNGLTYARDEIHVASGCKQVIFNCLSATLDPGDEVVVFTPAWVSYIDMVSFCGGHPVLVETTAAEGFLPCPDRLAAAMRPRTKWVILNTPNNPTGAVYPAELLERIGAVVAAHPRAMVLSDEIYEHLVFDGIAHQSFPGAVPALRSRTLLVNGVSKSYAMTGWRVGFAAGPAWLIEAMARVQSQTAGSSNSIGQAAAAAALTGQQSQIGDWCSLLQERRDIAMEILRQSSRVVPFRPQAAFYVFVNVSRCIGASTPEGKVLHSDADVAEYLLESALVATVPGSAFDHSPFLRLSFAVDRARVEEGCRRIVAALEGLSGPDGRASGGQA